MRGNYVAINLIVSLHSPQNHFASPATDSDSRRPVPMASLILETNIYRSLGNMYTETG